MVNFLISVLAFLVAISLLVAFHEWGHLCVARWLNVKVLRFSIGFGRIIWSRTSRSGIEYCISAIPLGGYVKMLDEREGPVAAHELAFAFNRQPVWKRMAIVFAGPLTNFLLAIILFIVVFLAGVTGVAPIVKAVKPDSPASAAHIEAHDEFIAIEGEPVETLMEVSRAMAQYLDKPDVKATLLHGNQPYTVTLPIPSLLDKEVGVLESAGLTMGLPAWVGEVDSDSPAEQAGLQAGDRIVSVDGRPLLDWMDLVAETSEHPNQTLQFDVVRAGKTIPIEVLTGENAGGQGFIGIHLDESLIRKEQYPLGIAVKKAFIQTYQYSWLTLKMIFLMVTGEASLTHLSGPVSIAQIAGATAKVGITYYLDFLAIISISLGVLNLLPVPMLDGGHILYYLIEVVRRKPLTEAAQMMGLRLGLLILVSLMAVAFYNDILRLV